MKANVHPQQLPLLQSFKGKQQCPLDEVKNFAEQPGRPSHRTNKLRRETIYPNKRVSKSSLLNKRNCVTRYNVLAYYSGGDH